MLNLNSTERFKYPQHILLSMDISPKDSVEEDKFPVPDRCWNRASSLERDTALSPQESKVAAMMIFGYTKDDIITELDISKSHYETIIYDRIPEKVERSRQTVRANLKHSPLGAHLQKVLADTDKKALVGCAGPDCDENVNTEVENPLFNDYYSKTINRHADGRSMSNYVEYHFCSPQCLVEYDRKI